MKALSLTQPWASLVANGAKRIETRSWNTSYRGPLVIHAAKGYPGWARELAKTPEFRNALSAADPDQLPLGVGLCVVSVLACVKTTELYKLREGLGFQFGVNELTFGNFNEGRFAWALERQYPFLEPIPANGLQRLWEWPHEVYQAEIQEHQPRIVCTACGGTLGVKMCGLGCFLCTGCTSVFAGQVIHSGESNGAGVQAAVSADGMHKHNRPETEAGEVLLGCMPPDGRPRDAQAEGASALQEVQG